MRLVYYIIFLMSYSFLGKGIAQCPNIDDLYFTSQSSIDLFIINYPNCTAFSGSVYIGGNSISNLNGLQNLTSISQDFGIWENHNLQNLTGLNNLNSVGGYLQIEFNDNLLNINGLEGMQSIGGFLAIGYNENLVSLCEFENLNYVNGYLSIRSNKNLQSIEGLATNLTEVGSSLLIYGNDELQTLNGMEALNYVGDQLIIKNNINLQSLSGLQNLNFIGGHLSIFSNPQLAICSIPPICNYIVSGSDVTIQNNATGCNNQDEVALKCADLGKIAYPCYYDFNENAIQDLGEPFVPNASVLIQPGEYTAYTNASNGGHKFLHFGTYNLSLNESQLPNWQLTSGTSAFSTTLDADNICDTFSFGLHPTNTITKLSTACVNALPRCNEYVTFEVLANNEGTTTAQGILWFEIDPAILNVAYLDQPDTLDGNNRVGWHFDNLFPEHTFKREISLQLPGPPNFSIGDFVSFGMQTIFEDENGFHSTAWNTHRVEVRCSFDPNDKLVSPQYPDDYALIGDQLVYTIRFQNTGNAEAYDIVIKDELDSHLDLSTFQYISSSHESVLSTFLTESTITFEFNDIFLPDSSSNFDESQGYVIYSIKADADIEELTRIENTAHIFFDYNPPIITNTTENIMVSTFDFDQDGFDIWNDCDDYNMMINTAATEILYNGIDDDCDEATLDDDLDQDGFGIANDCDDENPAINPNVIEYPYNGIDDDCNPLTLDDDLDQDGFGIIDDCNDNNPDANPDGIEIPNNGIDENCDNSDQILDFDQDGFDIDEDCDDNNPNVNPAAFEIPYNGIDDDCNEATLDLDFDQDGFEISEDCNDLDPLINPAATEIPYNGIDDDCFAYSLDDDFDLDGFTIAEDCDDGNYFINPSVIEIPNNGIDENCDGLDALVSINQLGTVQLQVFPNPTTDFIQVVFAEAINGHYELRDYNGQLILQNELQKETLVRLTDYPGGVYTLLVKTKKGVWVEQIVKM